MYNRKKNGFCVFFALVMVLQVQAQSISLQLTNAFAAFERDPQLKSAISSLYVLDAATGNVVYAKNENIGLAPASTQKIITAATAYELLGSNFRYETKFGYFGSLANGQLNGGLYVKPSGDPTLGSWRWPATKEDAVMKRLLSAVQTTGIQTFSSAVLDETGWECEAIPGGWIWNDVANYYGAGAAALNWRENQYDLILKSGSNVGDPVTVTGTTPKLYGFEIASQAMAAPKGTGDRSYIYFPTVGQVGVLRGTIPVNENRFVVSGAMPLPANQFMGTLQQALVDKGAAPEISWTIVQKYSTQKAPTSPVYFHTEQSPPLDSIVYWFLKRSINLYGEALAKTLAQQKQRTVSSENGADIIRQYWSEKELGIDKTELNMEDGSGLSPQNRVTTHAQAAVLQYAQKQPWFGGYYNAFPEFNGMKLKSGTIGGTKSFCGYHTSKGGKKYIVSFIVNNYNGSSSTLVQKMYNVLDVLK